MHFCQAVWWETGAFVSHQCLHHHHRYLSHLRNLWTIPSKVWEKWILQILLLPILDFFHKVFLIKLRKHLSYCCLVNVISYVHILGVITTICDWWEDLTIKGHSWQSVVGASSFLQHFSHHHHKASGSFQQAFCQMVAAYRLPVKNIGYKMNVLMSVLKVKGSYVDLDMLITFQQKKMRLTECSPLFWAQQRFSNHH